MTFQISHDDTPDPFMIKYEGTYILTFTTGNRVELWRSSLLHDFHDNVAAKRIIWSILSPPALSTTLLTNTGNPKTHR